MVCFDNPRNANSVFISHSARPIELILSLIYVPSLFTEIVLEEICLGYPAIKSKFPNLELASPTLRAGFRAVANRPAALIAVKSS